MARRKFVHHAQNGWKQTGTPFDISLYFLWRSTPCATHHYTRKMKIRVFLEMLQNSASEGARAFSCHLSTCLTKKKNEKRQPRGKGGGRLFWSHLCSHYPTFSLKLPLTIRISNNVVFMSPSYIDSYIHTRCFCEDEVAPPAYWVHRTPSSKLYLCASILSLQAIDETRMPVATITRTLSIYAQAHSNKKQSRQPRRENWKIIHDSYHTYASLYIYAHSTKMSSRTQILCIPDKWKQNLCVE